MKKENDGPLKFETLSEAQRAFGLPAPKHPLISLLNSAEMSGQANRPLGAHVLNFYKISYSPNLVGKRIRYGQHYYDFDEGGMLFAAPNQIIGEARESGTGGVGCTLYALLIHPDFFLGYPLAKKIRQYNFFSYSTHEALHLSESEKTTVVAIFKMIDEELNGRIDDFSQDVVVSLIELLLSHANRFYKRQFITRKVLNNDLLQKLDDLLEDYFNSETALTKGLPTVQQLAEHINVSPGYLSDMLRSLIGQNTQQYIHGKLIERAKEKLSTTSLSVSEVAYALGFEHAQSFSKLFKTKTNLSPLEFRRTFN